MHVKKLELLIEKKNENEKKNQDYKPSDNEIQELKKVSLKIKSLLIILKAELRYRTVIDNYAKISKYTYQLMIDVKNYKVNFVNPSITNFLMEEASFFVEVGEEFKVLKNLPRNMQKIDMEMLQHITAPKYEPLMYIKQSKSIEKYLEKEDLCNDLRNNNFNDNNNSNNHDVNKNYNHTDRAVNYIPFKSQSYDNNKNVNLNEHNNNINNNNLNTNILNEKQFNQGQNRNFNSSLPHHNQNFIHNELNKDFYHRNDFYNNKNYQGPPQFNNNYMPTFHHLNNNNQKFEHHSSRNEFNRFDNINRNHDYRNLNDYREKSDYNDRNYIQGNNYNVNINNRVGPYEELPGYRVDFNKNSEFNNRQNQFFVAPKPQNLYFNPNNIQAPTYNLHYEMQQNQDRGLNGPPQYGQGYFGQRQNNFEFGPLNRNFIERSNSNLSNNNLDDSVRHPLMMKKFESQMQLDNKKFDLYENNRSNNHQNSFNERIDNISTDKFSNFTNLTNNNVNNISETVNKNSAITNNSRTPVKTALNSNFETIKEESNSEGLNSKLETNYELAKEKGGYKSDEEEIEKVPVSKKKSKKNK